MKEIPLTRGKFAKVDDDDAPLLSQFKWRLRRTERGYEYARRHPRKGESGRNMEMHRFLLDAPAHLQVDHINGDGLDNRRSNLRLATHAQNQANRHRTLGTSQYKGVFYEGRYRPRWVATCRGKYLGSFATEELAARAYNFEAQRVFGEFAKLNFPSDVPRPVRRQTKLCG